MDDRIIMEVKAPDGSTMKLYRNWMESTFLYGVNLGYELEAQALKTWLSLAKEKKVGIS